MSALERAAVQRVIDMALDAGVAVPRAVSSLLLHADASYPASVFAARFPEGEDPVRHGCPIEAAVCCDSASYNGLLACTCWVPEFDAEQAEPVPPALAADLTARTRMCGDCVYRPDSPERADAYTAELLGMPFRADGTPAALCAGWVARAAAGRDA